MKKILFKFFFLFLLVSPNYFLFAQQENNDSLSINKNYEDSSCEKNRLKKYFHNKRPILQVNYGKVNFHHELVSNKFDQLGGIQLKLGYLKEKEFKRKYLQSIHENSLSISFFNKNLMNEQKSDDLTLETKYQISLGMNDGYAYNLPNFKFVLTNGNEFELTNSNVSNLVSTDSALIEPFNGYTRFGQAGNANVSLVFFDLIGIDFQYKFGTIFPRHLFWKHIGSILIEEATKSLLSNYIDKIFNNRPAAGPIISFLLNTSLKYAFYELRQDKMNWPFNSPNPLNYDFFSVGVKFIF